MDFNQLIEKFINENPGYTFEDLGDVFHDEQKIKEALNTIIKPVVIKGKGTGYKISSKGQVYNKKGKLVKGYLSKKGYPSVTIGKNPVFIHRLVANAFIPNPKNMKCVNHRDGVKTNNQISNIHWCTQSYNNQHAAFQLDRMVFCNPKYAEKVILPALKIRWSNSINKGITYFKLGRKNFRVILCTGKNQQKTIGYYSSFQDAVFAYKQAYKAFYGVASSSNNYCEKTFFSKVKG